MSESIKYGNTEIHFGALGLSKFEDVLINEYPDAKKVIITDENVFELWIGNIIGQFSSLSNAEIIQIPAGEENKNIEIAAHIWEALSEYEIGRNDIIINIGGGMITDLGGFVSSTFKRGLSFMNIPTTLLAQVDASVGGKTGIDLGPYKNQIGTFANPDHVFIDHHFISTLKDEEVLSGFAEMLKHGLIADASYWHELKRIDPKSRNELIPLSLIKRSVELKKKIVEQDPNENGHRKVLNFGHTIGHAIEGFYLSKGNPILHGFAVAWGMLAEAKLSQISEQDRKSIFDVLNYYYGSPVYSKTDISSILQIMKNDKKNKQDKICFSLLRKIGDCQYDIEIGENQIKAALEEIIT